MTRFHPYTVWEDWLNGMYEPCFDLAHVEAAAELLSDPFQLRSAMTSVTTAWPYATATVLNSRTGASSNSWMGHAACLFATGASKQETCFAWNHLSNENQAAANQAAESVAYHWRLGQVQGAFL